LAIVALGACHTRDDPRTTCAAVADHVFSLLPDKDDHARRVHDAFAHHCVDDGWPRAAIRCILDEPMLRSGRHCREQLSDLQRERLDRELVEIDDSRVPKPCVLFRTAVDKLGTCENVAPVLATQKRAYAQLKPKIDAVTHATFMELAELCDHRLAQLEQLAHAVGCDPPE
jgi:hypothetical protein